MIEKNIIHNCYVLLLKNEAMNQAQYINIKELEVKLNFKPDEPEISNLNGFIVDLKELDFIQSSAIGVLLILRKKITVLGKKIVLINANNNITAALELAGLLDFFNIYNSLEEAVNYLKK